MRIVLLLVLAISLIACKKEKESDSTEDNTTGSIIGTWELKESYSGMSPYRQHPSGNGNLLQFDDATYKIIAAGKVQQQGIYRLTSDSVTNVNTCVLEPPPSNTPNRLIFDNEIFLRRGFSATGKTLTLTTGCIPADGGVSKYRRIEAAQVQ